MDERRTPHSIPPILFRILDETHSAGAAGAEILFEQTTRARVEATGAEPPRLKQSSKDRLRVRLYVEGGGHADLITDSPEKARARIGATLAKAAKAKANPLAGPADVYPISVRGLGLDDPRHSRLTDEDRLHVVRAGAEACTSSNTRFVKGAYEDVRLLQSFLSSRGAEAAVSSTTYTVDLTVASSAHELDFHTVGRAFANVGALPYGAGLVKRLDVLRGKKVSLPTAETAIILPPRVLAWFLARIAPAFCADRVAAKKSFVSKVERVGSYRVHMTDDATLHGGPLTVAHDQRGVAPMPVPLLREGLPAGHLHSPETARAVEDARPTGHVRDGKLRPSNLVVRKGNRSRTQMLGEVPWSVFFDHVHGEIDLATGDFEVRGPGQLLKSGKPAGVLASSVLSGNVCDLLNGVVEIASDQQRIGHVDCATALIKGFEVKAG
ncbi:MAG: hypothetical protein GY913_23520 [Proteobacteria bacterium]|nr:hypothetical protein [Pseudomonadota bacterium]MCP4919883.1 hypothetical protein [Pseudomonadota bacterium]